MSKKIAVILSGAGHFDGAELRESILSLLVLDQAGAQVSLFAPDKEQFHVIDHLSATPTQEKRNVLTEAARIGRGKITALDQLNIQEFDGLVIPGGYGVAKNLSDFAFKGPDSQVEPDFER